MKPGGWRSGWLHTCIEIEVRRATPSTCSESTRHTDAAASSRNVLSDSSRFCRAPRVSFRAPEFTNGIAHGRSLVEVYVRRRREPSRRQLRLQLFGAPRTLQSVVCTHSPSRGPRQRVRQPCNQRAAYHLWQLLRRIDRRLFLKAETRARV